MLVAKKIRAKTQNSGWSDPSKKKKTRKPRKPMTEEQRQAAAERLKKAREARAKRILTMVRLVFIHLYMIWMRIMNFILIKSRNGLGYKRFHLF